MIIKSSQRSGARNLANHLMNTHDNDHVELFEVRGLAGNSLHAALLEIDGVSQGTRCQQPLFSVSFNPPEGEEVSYDQFQDTFDRLEKKLGLTDQPRAVVFHEKEGRRHAHVVWSRINVDTMTAINMSHFKDKCTDISRQIYLERGWDMPKGLINKRERDPFQLSNAEWQQMKRKGVDPKEIRLLCSEAWKHSDNLASFKQALEERNLFLAQGDKRGFVVLDHNRQVYSLSRYGGIKTKDLKIRLGSPDTLPTVDKTKGVIRSTYNKDTLDRISTLKNRHADQQKPLMEKKAQLVQAQRAERRELADQQRMKRHLKSKEGKDRFRRGIAGLFDKVSGREKRVRLINRKEKTCLHRKQKENRQLMIFRHNKARQELQVEIKALNQHQLNERKQLAKRIYEFRQFQGRDKQRETKLKQKFDRAKDKSQDRPRQRPERKRGRNRTRELEPD